MEMDFSAITIAVRCKKLLKQAGGMDYQTPKFPAFAWPGGYTLIYITNEGDVICADCMNDADNAEDNFIGRSRVVAVDTYDEGPTEFCANCNKELESSYGRTFVVWRDRVDPVRLRFA